MAGLEIAIQHDVSCVVKLPPEFAPFILDRPASRHPAATYIVGHPLDPSSIASSSPISWQSDLIRLRHLPAAQIAVEIFDATMSAWRLAATVSIDFASGTLHPGTVRPDLPFHHPHDRLILLGLLAHRAGGIIHSSCIMDQGRALVFVGRSGDGKTTLARLWRDAGATILNDERNVLRLENGIPLAGSSPWHGEENQVSPLHAPLAAVFFLRQAPSNSVSKRDPVEAVTRLFTSTLVPVFLPSGPDLILQSWGALFERIPAYELSFTPDRRAVDLCREVISGR